MPTRREFCRDLFYAGMGAVAGTLLLNPWVRAVEAGGIDVKEPYGIIRANPWMVIEINDKSVAKSTRDNLAITPIKVALPDYCEVKVRGQSCVWAPEDPTISYAFCLPKGTIMAQAQNVPGFGYQQEVKTEGNVIGLHNFAAYNLGITADTYDNKGRVMGITRTPLRVGDRLKFYSSSQRSGSPVVYECIGAQLYSNLPVSIEPFTTYRNIAQGNIRMMTCFPIGSTSVTKTGVVIENFRQA